MLFGSRRHYRSAGQGLVEFALILPIFVLIMGAIIQFGLIFWAQNTLTQVVRDTGRWEATQQTQCDTGGLALVDKADSIAQASSLIGYTANLWKTGTPAPFTTSSALREGIEVSWPLSTDQPTPAPNPPQVWTPADCPPVTNQIAWFVNIRAHHRVPLFFPFIGAFIPSCTATDCSLSSSVQFRMEPSK